MAEAKLLDEFVDQALAQLPLCARSDRVALTLQLTITIEPAAFLAAGQAFSRARLRRYMQEEIRRAFDLEAAPRRQSRRGTIVGGGLFGGE